MNTNLSLHAGPSRHTLGRFPTTPYYNTCTLFNLGIEVNVINWAHSVIGIGLVFKVALVLLVILCIHFIQLSLQRVGKTNLEWAGAYCISRQQNTPYFRGGAYLKVWNLTKHSAMILSRLKEKKYISKYISMRTSIIPFVYSYLAIETSSSGIVIVNLLLASIQQLAKFQLATIVPFREHLDKILRYSKKVGE